MKKPTPHSGRNTARNSTRSTPAKPQSSKGKTRQQTETGAKASTRQHFLQSYFQHHRKVAKESLSRLLKQPIASLMTWAVIGIALALPTGLSVLLTNVQHMSSGWDGSAQITLFLKQGIAEDAAKQLASRLEKRSDVASIEFISKEQALDEFKAASGFGDVLNYLDGNPLPNVIVVKPSIALQDPTQASRLKDYLLGLPEVEKAELDLQWVKRLYSITQLLQRGVWMLTGLLAAAVLLVIGNTIRLAIENRRDEIVVVKLVGGTDAFVRRPFLYTGLWFGLGGGIVSWLLVGLTLWWLNGPVQRLSALYYSSFRLDGMDFSGVITLLIMSMLLGWAGAWLAVRRHLGDIEPQ
jgi:cell division transport system permease protein